MADPYFIGALCTPMDEQENLHDEGLEIHLFDQWNSGIQGTLIGGTMGFMQMLRDQTYRDLIRRAVEIASGKIELLVGVGDTSTARTLDRIEYVNRFDVDGVVVLPPCFMAWEDDDLLHQLRTCADTARAPVFLYDLPQVVGRSMSVNMIVEAAKHPNIKGLKASGMPEIPSQVRELVRDDFRVILAQPFMIAHLLRAGFNEHLDGLFAMAPKTTVAIGEAARAGDWGQADRLQLEFNDFVRFLRDQGIRTSFPPMLNEHGVPGVFTPQPLTPLEGEELESLMKHPVVKAYLQREGRLQMPVSV